MIRWLLLPAFRGRLANVAVGVDEGRLGEGRLANERIKDLRRRSSGGVGVFNCECYVFRCQPRMSS